MRNTDPVATFSFSFPALKKGKVKVQKKKNRSPKKNLFSSRWKEKKTLRQENTVRLFFHRHSFRINIHTFPLFFCFPHCHILQNVLLCSFSRFPPFSTFRTAAVNMRSTPDTNQPPLIITAATKQENKYRREERRDEG